MGGPKHYLQYEHENIVTEKIWSYINSINADTVGKLLIVVKAY